MKYSTVAVENWDNKEWEERNTKNLVLIDMTKYPNNSIRHSNVYEKLLDNIDKIPLEDIENLLLKNNCL